MATCQTFCHLFCAMQLHKCTACLVCLIHHVYANVTDIICFLVLCRARRTHSYDVNSAATEAGDSDTRDLGGHWCWKGSERVLQGQVYKSSRSSKSSCQGLEAMYTSDLIPYPLSIAIAKASRGMYVRHKYLNKIC